MKIYKYFFYIRYKRWLKSEKWHDEAHLSAIFDITLLTSFNLITSFVLICKILFNCSHVKDYNRSQLIIPAIIFLALLFIFHYFLLCYKHKYLEVVKYIENLPKKEISLLRFYFWLYFILSFIVPIGLGLLYSQMQIK